MNEQDSTQISIVSLKPNKNIDNTYNFRRAQANPYPQATAATAAPRVFTTVQDEKRN